MRASPFARHSDIVRCDQHTAAPQHRADGQGPGTIPATHAGRDTGRRIHALSGKVEHAIGSMLGNNRKRAAGLRKEQEAIAANASAAEIAEAERLERDADLMRNEAAMRRDRAAGTGSG
jgi:hypothetical protein